MSVRLVPFAQAHLPDVARLIADPETLRHTRIPQPPPDGFAEEWLARYEAARHDGSREAFAIEDDDGTFLGLALAPSIEPEARSAELGYMVAPEARGRGVATEALRQLTAWALAEGLERLVLLITADNVASQRVAERAGYVREDVELWSLPPDVPPRTSSGVSASSDGSTASASASASGAGG